MNKNEEGEREMKIDKDIKIPMKGAQGMNMPVIKEMEVGDSVLFEGSKCHTNANNFASTGRHYGYKLTQRSIDDGVRVWLTEIPDEE